MHKITILWRAVCLLIIPLSGFTTSNYFQKQFYAGVSGGLGSTTWSGLVPAPEKQNSAINISTPVEVHEGGRVWNVFTGYEFTPYFAIQATYRHYPHATVIFKDDSMFAFEHDDRLSFTTTTNSIDVMAKIMLVIPKTTLRLFSGIGVAKIYREDEIANHFQISPTFGGGL